MLLKHFMAIPEVARLLRIKHPKDDQEEKEVKLAWKMYRRLQCLTFYPKDEVARALYMMMIDPSMR
jgi:hypothetical protein